MSTPNPIFPPLTESISWVDSTTADGAVPLPAGETVVSTTLGIRADGDSNFGPGNYQYRVPVAAPAQSISLTDLNAALGKPLAPGNYWLAAEQTDKLGDLTADSKWTPEVGFSIPPPRPVAPASPTAVSVK